MNSETLYNDRLVEITRDAILFKTYYFPFGAKRILFSEVESIKAVRPTLRNGRFRIHGSGDLDTWFPRDWKRPRRDRIFFMRFRRHARRIGFTVEHSPTVERILEERLH